MNGRILESDVLSHGLESGYRTDLMQHQFPFAVLYLTIPQNLVDVNIHPAKREVRFSDSQKVYEFIDRSVFRTLHKEELIPRATLQTGKEIREEEQKEKEALAGEHIEPFEIKKTGRPSPEYSGKPETAAEVTINYVITDVEKKRKFVCVDPHDIPVVAVIDPDMMSSMPKGLTAATGMDALTHAIILGEFMINIIFYGFVALGAPTAIQDVITGFALLIIITLTTKINKGEIVK